MAMVLTEEQTLLQQSAREFATQKSPVAAFRKLRDEGSDTGYAPELWQQMVELGWAGIIIPENYGGVEFGYQGLGIVLEETGRTLTASPLFATAMLGATALLLAGNDQQKTQWLPKIAAGEATFAFALEEKAHHAPFDIALSAEKTGDRFRLNGEKTFVFDGHVADQLIVVARTSGNPGDRQGLSLFLIDAHAAGLARTRTIMVDHRNAANLILNNVELGQDALLGPLDGAGDCLEQILDRARICLAAEMLGTAQQAFDLIMEHLTSRTQFGQLIGAFQSLQHRAAQMFCELEISRSIVLEALTAIDDQANDVAVLASLAKAKVSDTLHLVSLEGIQMHGGIGMTDEFDIGFYLKRARIVEQAFGDARFHRNRFAALEGF